MKILHIASFTGNIGDEANHIGFRKNFRKNISSNAEFDEIEIRRFYKSWNELKFDDDFVKKANLYDLVVFGGGNFFELCWDYSSTGTTIDLSKEILEKIKTKVLFNGIGVDDGKGTNPENINKFRNFLNYVLNDERFLFSVRNDGSMKILKKYFATCKLERVNNIPDGAFSLELNDRYNYVELDTASKNIGINIAGDMLKTRFNTEEVFEMFIKQFSNTLNNIMEENKNINLVFIPHMYADIEIISKIINNIKDRFRRFRISLAPLLNGNLSGGEYIFGLYKKCNLILGMRFHSNVCAIAQNIPNIGMVTYHKHKYVFDEIGLSDRCIVFNDRLLVNKFWNDFQEDIINSLENADKIKQRYKLTNLQLQQITNDFYIVMKEWLNK